MPFTILVTVPKLATAGVERLSAAGCRTLYVSRGGGEPELVRLLRDEPVDAVISRTLPLGGAAIRACPTLKVISRHGVGYNNVDLEAATERRIPVLIAPATNGQSVAELAIGLLLAVARAIPAQDAAIRRGVWNRSGSGLQLSGRVFGLIGLGGIGRAVARAAQGLGMQVMAFDQFQAPGSAPVGVTLAASLDELLGRVDVLSLHCPLTPQTRGIIGQEQLARLRRGSIVINTARGGLIDEAALAEAIQCGRLAGAGLDTFADEPLPSASPLRHLPGVVMTPHMGGSTDAALGATAAAAVDHALQVLRGEPVDPALCVNPTTLPDRRPTP